jgi:chromosome segregation ATPase
MFDLGDFPTSLSAIVNIKNKRISSITKAAGDEKREIIQLSEQLNQRDQKIKSVESEFANKVSEKKLKDAELLGLKKSLQSLTMVSQMVKINLGNIKAMSEA